jgi:hypothetical protein
MFAKTPSLRTPPLPCMLLRSAYSGKGSLSLTTSSWILKRCGSNWSPMSEYRPSAAAATTPVSWSMTCITAVSVRHRC